MKKDSTADISIIVHVYNHEKFLAKTFAGIEMQQIEANVEVIVHDDASTDQSEKIYRQYAENSRHTVKIIKQAVNQHSQNVGFINQILAECTGKMIALCDGDDFWISPVKLSNQYKALECLPQVDICFHKAYRVQWESEAVIALLADYGEEPKLFAPGQVIEGDGGFMPTVSLLFRTSILQSLPAWFYDSPPPPARDFFWQVFGSLRGGALYLPMCAAAYREGHPASWTQQTIANMSNLLKFEKNFIEYLFLLKKCVSPECQVYVDRLIMRRFIDISTRCYQNQRVEDFRSLVVMLSNHFDPVISEIN